jgi:hypothetical protein
VSIRITAKVSKGTYIRTLGEDIGEALGCGAHLCPCAALPPASLTQSQCVTLEALEAMSEDDRLACLQPVAALLPDHTASRWTRQCRPVPERPAPPRRLARQRPCGRWFGDGLAAAAPPTCEGRRTDPGATAEPPEIQQILETPKS